jgi:hypothetical protein
LCGILIAPALSGHTVRTEYDVVPRKKNSQLQTGSGQGTSPNISVIHIFAPSTLTSLEHLQYKYCLSHFILPTNHDLPNDLPNTPRRKEHMAGYHPLLFTLIALLAAAELGLALF